ncbi:MAG: hypothetical protein H6741_24945 [Alphaproteobacteria bacterium]|nr:hypothetical protein [Alphaproteobacteria bacterium]MCB9795956.1 hypothetical protein [Alphaproteobacteria bacterium]
MPSTLLEVAYGDMLYQLDAAPLVWPAAGALLGLVLAILAIGLRWTARETRPAVISVVVGYVALGLQAVGAAVVWMPVEASLGDSRHVGSLFSGALWTDLALISVGFGLSAFAAAFWWLHRPEEDPQRLPVGLGFILATLLSFGLAVPGHVWGVQVAAVGLHPSLLVDSIPRFHVGQRIERQPRLGWMSTQGLLFKRTVWVDLDGARREAWDVPPVTLAATEPGAHTAVMWAARGPFTMRQDLHFELGEDTGDPRLTLAPGQRWQYAQVGGYRGSIAGLFSGEETLPEDAATLTLEVSGEQVVEGLRLLTLTRTDVEGATREFQVYNMDGQTLLRVEDGEDRPLLAPDRWMEEALPEDAEGPEGLWACETPLLTHRGCWCFEAGQPRQGVAFCSLDTTDHTPSLVRGVLAILTVGITEITGAMRGVGSTHTEAGLVLLPE